MKVITLGTLSICLLLTGCGSLNELCRKPNTFCPGPSRVELDHGTSYNLAKFNQVLNPGAGKTSAPAGFDGGAAKAAVEQYRKSFEEKPAAPVYSINVGKF